MNLNQINKQYIRQNIPEDQQAQFFDYFVQLKDHHLFHQWKIARTIQVVQAFKITKRPKQSQTKSTYKEDVQKPSDVASCRVSTKKENQSHQQTESKVRSSSVSGKKESAMDFLKEIEASFLKTPTKNSKTTNSWNRVEDNIWLNFNTTQVRVKAQKNIVNQDLFENFDKCIANKSETKQKNTVVQKQPRITHQPELKLKVELKRSLEVRNVIASDLRKSRSQLRQKKSTNSDKLFKQKLNQQLPCKKLRQQKQKMRISVTGHQMVHRTLLPDYALYHIMINSKRTLCKRTYDNFLDMINIMEKLYPGVKVPSLDSGSWFSESDIVLINKNKLYLELFLNDIVEHPMLSKTKIVKEFFSVHSPKQIQKILLDFQKIPEVNNLAELVNQKGSIKVTLSEQINKVVEQLPKWKKYFGNYLQNYEDLISTLTSQFQSVKLTYDQIVKLSGDFQSKIKQLVEIKTVIDLQPFDKLLDKQINYFDRKRNDLEKQIVDLKDSYTSVIKYEKLNVLSFEPMIEKVHTLTQKYLKRLQIEPESPCSVVEPSRVGSTTNFNTDIWHQNQNMTLFKYQLGYLTAQLITQQQIFNTRMTQNLNQIWEKVFER